MQWWLKQQHVDEHWCFTDNIFSSEECDTIVELLTGGKVQLQEAVVGGSVDGRVDKDIRDSTIGWVPTDDQTAWIFQKLTDGIMHINERFYKYDLLYIENLQFTVYDSVTNQYYGKHIDMMYKTFQTRKLSFSVQLTDPAMYKGGDFVYHHGRDPMHLPRTKGTCLYFPSWALHEVTPVTEGTRYALVGWVVGPQFK